MSHIGSRSLACAIFLIIAVQATEMLGYGWLALWSTDSTTGNVSNTVTRNDTSNVNTDIHLRHYRVGIYAALGLSQGMDFLGINFNKIFAGNVKKKWLMLQLLRPVLPNFPYLLSTFHLEYPPYFFDFAFTSLRASGGKLSSTFKSPKYDGSKL